MSAPSGRLRVGVIGVGHLGRHHVRLLAAMPRVDLVAAVDLVGDRARAAVEGTTAEAHEDYRAVLGRVDAVTIAVPTSGHLADCDSSACSGVSTCSWRSRWRRRSRRPMR